MFRPPKQQRRAVSIERATVKRNEHDGQQLMQPRAASSDPSKRRSAMPLNNQELRKRIPVRRSVPAVLNPIRQDRIRYPSGGLGEVRAAKPIMGTARSAAIQHRLQLADPGAYNGPQTRARAMLDKRTITSTTSVNIIERKETEQKPQATGEAQREHRAVISTTSIHRRSAVGSVQTTNRKDGPPLSFLAVPENQRRAISANVVAKEKTTSAIGGGHVPRDRTRRNAQEQKGPVRMMRVSTTSSKGLPSVGSERRFRESVTRRQRGGESLERVLKTEQHQMKQTVPRELRNPKTATSLPPKTQKHATASASGNPSKLSTRRSENRPQTKVSERMRSLDRGTASKKGQVGEKGPPQAFHRRPSAHLTEAEREALFARLSTPRSVVTKNVASTTGGTPKKPSVKITAKPDGKRRSDLPVPGHPATRGLRAPVLRTRSNPGSQNSSRPGSAIDSECVDERGLSGVESQREKTDSASVKPGNTKRSQEASRVKHTGHKTGGGHGDVGDRAEGRY